MKAIYKRELKSYFQSMIGYVFIAFLCWLKQQNPIRNSRLDKAVTYTLNRADDMMTYLEDGRCSFTNNASERGMKSFVIGRKTDEYILINLHMISVIHT